MARNKTTAADPELPDDPDSPDEPDDPEPTPAGVWRFRDGAMVLEDA